MKLLKIALLVALGAAGAQAFADDSPKIPSRADGTRTPGDQSDLR